jgi:hypothetical protein
LVLNEEIREIALLQDERTRDTLERVDALLQD